jgi:hypothetical protein
VPDRFLVYPVQIASVKKIHWKKEASLYLSGLAIILLIEYSFSGVSWNLTLSVLWKVALIAFLRIYFAERNGLA